MAGPSDIEAPASQAWLGTVPLLPFVGPGGLWGGCHRAPLLVRAPSPSLGGVWEALASLNEASTTAKENWRS